MHFTKLPLFVAAALAVSAVVAQAAPLGLLERRFNNADLNSDGVIDRTEFLALQPRSKSWVDAMHRFNQADVDRDGLLSRTEFLASKGGKKGQKPNRIQSFVLADIDSDGFLDPEEFARTLSQGNPWRKVLKTFARRDKNKDFLISPREFGIQVR